MESSGVRRVYIAGPISGLSEEEYMRRFKLAEKKVKQAGYIPINPTVVSKHFPDFDWRESMIVTEVLLSLCDSIYLIDGWENSKGARIEAQYAKERGYNVFVNVNGKMSRYCA